MAKAPTPRCIFIRHGQTEWSKSGQHTSFTDLDLTPFGVKQMEETGKSLIGYSSTNLLRPCDVKLIICSPRTRAKHTRDLILASLDPADKKHIEFSVDEEIREWEYGDYEGMKSQDIKNLRSSRGLGAEWDIWKDGCENGESAEDVTIRVDRVISRIREIHQSALDNKEACDVIVVAHGHILRCFAARWVGRPININPQFMLDAGGVGVLSYQHHNIEEPAVFLAGAFMVPVEEESADL